MTAPDLSSDAGRAAYRSELKAVGRGPRLIGFLLILAGALMVLPAYQADGWPQALVFTGYAAIAAGWVLFIAVVWLRNRHHRRRMAEKS